MGHRVVMVGAPWGGGQGSCDRCVASLHTVEEGGGLQSVCHGLPTAFKANRRRVAELGISASIFQTWLRKTINPFSGSFLTPLPSILSSGAVGDRERRAKLL